MTNALKSAMLSALVFPGLGQIALKRYRRGVALMLTSLASVAMIVAKAAREALSAFETLQSGGGVMNQDAISLAVGRSAGPSDGLTFTLLVLVSTICWMYSVVDAYRIGRQQDRDVP